LSTKMSSYKRQRKALIQEIAKVEKFAVHESDDRRVKILKVELLILDSEQLRERASQFGIDLVSSVGPWEADDTRLWLAERVQINARRLLEQARFEWWQKWVGLLSPVISTIIALLALILAAFALYLQLSGTPH